MRNERQKLMNNERRVEVGMKQVNLNLRTIFAFESTNESYRFYNRGLELCCIKDTTMFTG